MTLIEWGSRVREFGEHERFIKFRLPWKRERYCINRDDSVMDYPTYLIAWYHPKPRPDCTVARWGWV